MGNLYEVSLAEACERFRRRLAVYFGGQARACELGYFEDLDHFPCWYCVKYLGMVSWVKRPLLG